MIVVRYADDFVAGFQHRQDADRFLAALHDRFAQFALEVHPDKTRLIEFGRHAGRATTTGGDGKPQTFTFLGFTHCCVTSRTGRFRVGRLTDKKRMRAKRRSVKAELRRRMHLPIAWQGAWLRSVLRGHFVCYAVPGNSDAIRTFRYQLGGGWHAALRRRSQRNRGGWTRTMRLIARWFPPGRISHPWPLARFDATTQGRSPAR